MSLLKQEITDLKSGKCVEHARAAAVREERAMCRGSLDASGKHSLKQVYAPALLIRTCNGVPLSRNLLEKSLIELQPTL